MKSAYWRMRGLLPSKAPTGLEPAIFGALGIGPVHTVFDVGANIGQTAEQLAAAYPMARIYSFEPVASTYATLSNRLRSLHNVSVFNLALGDEPGRATITAVANDQRNRLVRDDEVAAGTGMVTQSIEVDSLDRFCAARGIVGPDL